MDLSGVVGKLYLEIAKYIFTMLNIGFILQFKQSDPTLLFNP